MLKVQMITDGAARGNPDGPGGYGTIVRYLDEKGTTITKEEEFAEGFKITSNNRMEMLAVIVGLESLNEPAEVTVISDSKYVVDAFNSFWINNWIVNGWFTSTHQPVKNVDLWKRLLEAKKPHNVKFIWVKGHNGHADNERCDFLATSMADGIGLVKGKDGKYYLPEGTKPTDETDLEITNIDTTENISYEMKKKEDGSLYIKVNGIVYDNITDVPDDLLKKIGKCINDLATASKIMDEDALKIWNDLIDFSNCMNPPVDPEEDEVTDENE